ncbi:SHOCT domain-containing protein [Vannielia litorea]
MIALIEKLAALKANGILTDAEFETKKAELLARL